MSKQSYKQNIRSFFLNPDTRFILPTAVYHVGVILFAGSLIMFGIGVAPTLFKIMPTKDLAGMANQAILTRMVILQGLGLLIMGGALVLLRKWSGILIRKSLWFILLVLAVMYFLYGILVQQAMFSLQPMIGSFDNPLETGKHALEQFRQLHKLYSFLSSFAALLSIASMIFLMYVHRVQPKDNSLS